MVKIIYLIFFLLNIITAHADEKIVIRAQIDLYGFIAQDGIVFDPKTVSFVRNSNTFCKNTNKVLLGKFQLPKEKRQSFFNSILEIQKNSLSQISVHPHEMQFFINSLMVDDVSAKKILTLFEQECSAKDWFLEDAIYVTFLKNELKLEYYSDNKKVRESTSSFDKFKCQRSNMSRICTIPRFGQLFIPI